MNQKCKNCNQKTLGNFCSNCGQSTNTHRYSFQHFIQHDFIHGVWHVHGGIFYTIKELFTRPGHSIREYINGKRINHFNAITLIIIIIGINHYIETHFLTQFSEASELKTDKETETYFYILNFIETHPKIMPVISVISFSLLSFLWFRKSKLNLSEHFILNAYKVAAEILFSLLVTIIYIFIKNETFLDIIGNTYVYLLALYSSWFYFQFFSKYNYSKKALVFRIFGILLSYCFVLLILVGTVYFNH